MSNPAVFRLNKLSIRDNVISIEDNIGESIHFHLGLVRFDLSVNEFDKITQTLLSVLDEQVKIANFNLHEQNEYFLERIAPYIPYIESVEDTIIPVQDIKCYYEKEFGNVVSANLTHSPIYHYYSGEVNAVSEYDIKRDIWKSKEDLLEYVKNHRNTNIYIDKNNYILDGQKSICAGLALGDIEDYIPAKRITCLDEKMKYVLLKERREW